MLCTNKRRHPAGGERIPGSEETGAQAERQRRPGFRTLQGRYVRGSKPQSEGEGPRRNVT